MSANKLKINSNKTEFMVIGKPRQKTKICFSSIKVDEEVIESSKVVRNLGVQMDDELRMDKQVNSICKSCYMHLKSIKYIRPFLTKNATIAIVQALISSRLDYCNSLLYGISNYLVRKLQRVQNCAARLIMNAKKRDSISKSLMELHWLPIAFRIEYKLLLLVYKCVYGLAPKYLENRVSFHNPDRLLRSNDKLLLTEPRSNLKTAGDRCFSVAGPKRWNKLPLNIRKVDKIDEFKKELKTYLFRKAFL